MGDVFHNLLSYNLVRAEGYGEPLTVRAFGAGYQQPGLVFSRNMGL